MADSLEVLEARRAALQERADRLAADNPNDIPGTYVTGRSGVPASRTKRLNRQIERSVDRAVEFTKTLQELRQVESRIEWLRSDGPGKMKRREDLVRRAQEDLFTRIQVGDLVNVGGNHPVKVFRKNRKSVTTDGGVRFAVYEIYGIDKSGSDL